MQRQNTASHPASHTHRNEDIQDTYTPLHTRTCLNTQTNTQRHALAGAFYLATALMKLFMKNRITESRPPSSLSLSLPADWTLSTLSFKRLDLAMPLNATVR